MLSHLCVMIFVLVSHHFVHFTVRINSLYSVYCAMCLARLRAPAQEGDPPSPRFAMPAGINDLDDEDDDDVDFENTAFVSHLLLLYT